MKADIDLGELGFSEGAHLLVKRALRKAGAGQAITVAGTSADLEIDLRAWCRDEGDTLQIQARESNNGRHETHAVIVNGGTESSRWAGAEHAGEPNAAVANPPRRWGLAARGATVEAGTPEFDFQLMAKAEVWADDAARLYAQAVASQWDPATAILWDTPFELDADVEDAVVQIMTYLIENETAALIVPSRFIAQLHPHFREVMQLLAVQAADEARHIEIFTHRALLKRNHLGLSTIGGQASLKTLVDEPDFAIASFLLSTLGEGTFLSLLWFIERYAPDPVTAAVAKLAAQDEARHVAFSVAHLAQHLNSDSSLRPRLADAVHRRNDALRHTAGLNAEVFDALVLIAAGSWEPGDIREGHRRVMELTHDMHESRQKRLRRLGFTEAQAADLSGLHTRNFM
jgi:TusA-related sulfurtransferase